MQLWQPEKIDMALGFLLRLLESASAKLWTEIVLNRLNTKEVKRSRQILL